MKYDINDTDNVQNIDSAIVIDICRCKNEGLRIFTQNKAHSCDNVEHVDGKISVRIPGA